MQPRKPHFFRHSLDAHHTATHVDASNLPAAFCLPSYYNHTQIVGTVRNPTTGQEMYIERLTPQPPQTTKHKIEPSQMGKPHPRLRSAQGLGPSFAWVHPTENQRPFLQNTWRPPNHDAMVAESHRQYHMQKTRERMWFNRNENKPIHGNFERPTGYVGYQKMVYKYNLGPCKKSDHIVSKPFATSNTYTGVGATQKPTDDVHRLHSMAMKPYMNRNDTTYMGADPRTAFQEPVNRADSTPFGHGNVVQGASYGVANTNLGTLDSDRARASGTSMNNTMNLRPMLPHLQAAYDALSKRFKDPEMREPINAFLLPSDTRVPVADMVSVGMTGITGSHTAYTNPDDRGLQRNEALHMYADASNANMPQGGMASNIRPDADANFKFGDPTTAFAPQASMRHDLPFRAPNDPTGRTGYTARNDMSNPTRQPQSWIMPGDLGMGRSGWDDRRTHNELLSRSTS